MSLANTECSSQPSLKRSCLITHISRSSRPPNQIITGGEHLKLLEQAVTVPSAATDAISDVCRQAGVVVSIGINERDHGTLYNTQLLFDADGALLQRRRKISPTYHERMIWDRAMARACARWKARSDGLGNWRVGSPTTLWRGTR